MGFQYNGISSQSMNIKARLTGWQMVPALRSNTETVPGKAGLADFGADSGERYIDVSCNVYPQKTFAGLVAVLDRAAAWLDPTVGTKQLVLDDVPDRYFMARLSDTDTRWMMKPLPSPKRGSMRWSVKSETQTPSRCIPCRGQFPPVRLY